MQERSAIGEFALLMALAITSACSPTLRNASHRDEHPATVSSQPNTSGTAEATSPTSQCDEPLGSACNPIVVDSFPFSHTGDTSGAAETYYDSYSCSPSTDERGPEIHYRVVLDAPALLRATVEEAEGVDVDLHLLRTGDPDDCLERSNSELAWPLAAGTHRLVVDTYFDGEARSGAYTVHVDIEPPTPRRIGTMWNTYYILANEADHEGPHDVPIFDSNCQELARVRADFHDDLCIEGSGMLIDRRIVNFASRCTDTCEAARQCGDRSYRICYQVLDSTIYPYAMGARQVALVPDLSVAVDRDFVSLGSVIYLEELDGIIPPGATAPHDGCVRADDVGGAIEGNHFDFFVGSRERWLAWERLLPTRSELTAWVDHPRCYGRYERGWP